jgi:RNA polymerase sigma factor (sigma-70 family)
MEYHDSIARLARKLARDFGYAHAAEDAAQEALIACLRVADRYDPDISPAQAWFFAHTRWSVIQSCRLAHGPVTTPGRVWKAKNRAEHLPIFVPVQPPNDRADDAPNGLPVELVAPEVDPLAEAVLDDLIAQADLPPAWADTVERMRDGWGPKEIADDRGCSRQNVSAQWIRAKERMVALCAAS